MNVKKYSKIIIKILLCLGIVFICYYFYYVNKNIPGRIFVEPYTNSKIDFNLPFVGTADVRHGQKELMVASINLMEDFEINSYSEEAYSIDVKLFGVFKVKEVDVIVKEAPKVIACGIPIGIFMKTNGVLVVDVDNILTDKGQIEAPARGRLKAGDYIYMCNNNLVKNNNELINLIDQSEGVINLTVFRDEEELEIAIKPVKDNNGNNKIGIWVRDDIQGLGTLTYVTENGEFGALGHGICDEKTGKVIKLDEGAIYTAKIWSLVKSESGKPGEIVGSINYSEENFLGSIEVNSTLGIYGETDDNVFAYIGNSYINSAYKQEVEFGDAVIRSFVDGEIKDYNIKIYDMHFGENDNKGITFEVTDENLIDITNGIIQGMSGSPIIQDGRLIGAVTHVFVDNPHKGYGIFFEEMLQ